MPSNTYVALKALTEPDPTFQQIVIREVAQNMAVHYMGRDIPGRDNIEAAIINFATHHKLRACIWLWSLTTRSKARLIDTIQKAVALIWEQEK